MGDKLQQLHYKPLPYAYWTDLRDPETGSAVWGLGAHRFCRFPRPVELHEMILSRPASTGLGGGGTPDIVTMLAYNDIEPVGEVLFEGKLPWDGECVRLDLHGKRALAVSLRCHWKHPVEPSFTNCHPAQWTIPFGVFDAVTWRGRILDEPVPEPPAPPVLLRGPVRPAGTDGLRASTDGLSVHYESAFLKLSFSLKRPRISYLSWDASGEGRTDRNLLVEMHSEFGSGPWLRDLGYALPPMLWGGSVEVDGTTVTYRDLKSIDSLTIDAQFSVSETGFDIDLTQKCEAGATFLEAEAWRFVWNGASVFSIGTLAQPLRGNHRNGRVMPHGGWHCSGQGTLTFSAQGPEAAVVQVESLGWQQRKNTSGLQLGCEADPYGPVRVVPGSVRTTFEMRVGNAEPALRPELTPAAVHSGLRRAWGSAFAFRPEGGGLSNNSSSINCNNCLYMPADMAVYSATSPGRPSLIDLVEYHVELALKGGPGYASHFEYMMDAAPSLLISAGQVYRAKRNVEWLKRLWPLMKRPVTFILGHIDESGMYRCLAKTGVSGIWGDHGLQDGCNCWDSFFFGHHDAYSGALAYRALRNASVLARVAGDSAASEECEAQAATIRGAFARDLLNPETGWLAGWRSADGELHDYCFSFVNGIAVCYGLVDDEQAVDMLSRLESRRIAAGLDDFRYGVPPQFVPVPRKDTHPDGVESLALDFDPWYLARKRDGSDTFGVFTNGGLTPCLAYFYLNALSRCGFTETADQICDQLLPSFDSGVFDGSLNGAECYTFDGMRSGFEGTLAHSFYVLLAIAQHKGWIRPHEPEWWPQD